MFVPPGEKIVDTRTCSISGEDFVVTEKDVAFLDRLSPIFGGVKHEIPLPTLSPEQRMLRRLAWRNERKLYRRSCDLTGKNILSVFSPDADVVVCDQKVWWSDRCDPFAFGCGVSFDAPFFPQFQQVFSRTPLPGFIGKNLENSEYTIYSGDLKDCYMVVSNIHGERLMYGYQGNASRDCIDFYQCNNCEGLYEAVNCYECHHCLYVQNCTNCRDVSFCADCESCSDCFLCVGLRHKQYCIRNKQYSKEKYSEEIKKFRMDAHQSYGWEEFRKMKGASIHRSYTGTNNEDSIGDYIHNCKDCVYVFDYAEGENLRYVGTGRGSKDCMDCNYSTGRDCYECLSPFPSSNVLFSLYGWDSSFSSYLAFCQGDEHCFGCVSLKKSKNCILNVSYSLQEYETLCGKLMDHMISTREWGEFFPHVMSPFGYNETVANEYCPLSKEEVSILGWNWKEDDETLLDTKKQVALPIAQYDEKHIGSDRAKDNIHELLQTTLICEETGRPFKIIAQELAYYIEHKIPVPTKHPDKRHDARRELRNPRRLYDRKCEQCESSMITSFSPDRSEKVYCENCYRSEMY